MGTITFLFTDLEGSTRLLKEHASAYAGLLDRQRTLIRDAASWPEGAALRVRMGLHTGEAVDASN